MTLRTKVTIALIVLSALATASIGEIGYLATDRQLTSEIDSSLRDVAAYAAAQPGGHDGFDGHAAVQLQTVLVQELSPNGTVVSSPEGASVPVSAADIMIATRGSGQLYRQVTVAGHPYRMLTAAGDHGAVQVLRPLAESRAVLNALRLRIALAALGVILAAAVSGWLISRQVTRRLRELAAAAGVVAETGRLDVMVDQTGTDETAQVAGAFSRMLAALDRSHWAQRRLVQDAGHELRTPLTSLRTNLDVLVRHPDLDPVQRAAVVADLQGEMRELTLLVDELVELSLGAGSQSPPERVTLAEVARRAVERARRRSGRVIELTADGSTVRAVPAQLERAMSNLLDNAIKFSQDDRPIEVAVLSGRASVRDHGAGFAEADLPRVFDRFYRSDGARQLPGSGLGLSIVADVAGRAGGSVFAGNHPGGGAVVGLVLPADSNPALTLSQPHP